MATLNIGLAFGDALVDVNTDPRIFAEPIASGQRHHPISHAVMWDLIKEQLDCFQLSTIQDVHALSADGSRYFGLVEIGNDSGNYSDLIAFRSTHDQRFGITISSGSGVWICSNLCIGGANKVKTKHTTNVMSRLPGLIATGLEQAILDNARQKHSFENYRSAQLTPTLANAIMTEMVRRGIISGSQLGGVIKEYDTPSHDEHTTDGFTVWRLFNAVTESAYKPNNGHTAINALMDKSPKLMTLLDEVIDRM